MKKVLHHLFYSALLLLAMKPIAEAQGSLSGSVLASGGASVNLTTQGSLDWAHAGLSAATDINHKNGANLILPATPFVIDGGTINRYTDNQVFFTWTDGTPAVTATNTTNGVYTNGGFEFTAPADTTTRVLKVYVGGGGSGSSGTLTAHLSDSSAADYVDTSVSSTGVGNIGDASHYYAVYTLVYKAGAASKTLDVKWEQSGGTGNITIQAVTLALKPVAVPATPTSLTAVAGDTRVSLGWVAAAGADSYNVKRSTTNGGPYTTVGSTIGTSLQDTGLTNGTTYYYVVTAANATGESANSNQASAAVASNIDGTGLPGSYFYGNSSPGGAAADNNGNPLFLPGDFLFTELDPTINFDFLANPNPSLPSTNNFTAQWTGLIKAQVTGPVVFSIGSDDGSRLYLDGQLIVNNYFYQGVVYRFSAPINLVAGSLHVIRVNYFEGGGGTAMYLRWSYPGQLTQIIPQYALYPTYGTTPPPAPVASASYGQGGIINVGWTTIDNATSYKISRSTTAGGPYTQLATGLTNQNPAPGGLLESQTYTDTTTTVGTTYYYVIDATNANGTARSNEALIKSIGGFNGTGLTAEYHSGDNNANPPFLPGSLLFTQIDPVINFDFVANPVPGLPSPPNNFSVRWTGLIQAPVTGTYTFYTASDDGTRLWIDGRLVVDNYFYQGTTTRSGTISLVAGTFHSIRVQFFQGGGGATAYAYWSFPGQSQQIIPQYALFPTYGTVVPGAPRLTGLPGGKSVTLNWSQPDNATSYTVYRSLTTGGPYTQIATVPGSVPAILSGTYTATYTDTGLTDGTPYFYVVTASNANGTSDNSNQVSVSPTAAVVGTGIGLAGFYYAWNPDTDFAAENDPLTTYSLAPTVNYNQGNPAIDGSGPWPAGVPATLFTAVFTGQLLAPYTGAYTFQTNTDDGIQVTVNGQLVISNATDHGPTIDTTVGNGLTAINLVAGTKYDIKVEFWQNGGGYTCQLYYNPLGSGAVIIPQSQLFPVFTIAPDPITDLAAAAGSQSVLLTWSTPLYAATYNVMRGTTTGGPYSQIATGVTGNSYLDTAVTSGTTYYYVLKAVNNIGTSANSNEASATPVAAFASNGDGLYGLYHHGGALDFSAENNSAFLARIDPTINYNVGNNTGNNPGPFPAGVPTINFTAVWTGQFLAPYTGAITLQTITDDGVRLSIDLNDGNGLQVQFDDETGHGPLANTASPVNLIAGHKYPIKIEYTQGGGGDTAQLLYAVQSGPFVIIPQSNLFSNLTTPAVPANLTASSGNGRVGLSWNFASQALSYNVLRRLSPSTGAYSTVATGVTSPTYVDTSVVNGTTYYYVVQAVNPAGTSGNSNQASATPSADTLVLHYTFENGPSGLDPDPITDVSVHGNNGLAIGGDTDFTSDAQQGLWAGVTTDNTHYLALPNALDFGPQFTFFAWVKIADVGGIQTIVASNGSGGSTSGFAFYVNDVNTDNHDLVFETNALVGGNNIQTKATSPGGIFPLGDGLYHAVACVVNAPAGKVTMYLDGVAVATNATIDNQWPTMSGANTLGIFPSTLDELNPGAQFDDVRVYNIMLSASDIAALSSNGPKVTGRIALEGVNDLTALSPGAPLGTFHVSFRTPNTLTEVFGADVTLTPVGAGNPNGTYSISGVPNGTYDVVIKGNKSLRVSVATSLTISGAFALPDAVLPAGDANNDNHADIGDFGPLVNSYETTYDPNDPGNGYDPTADFNYDGRINIGDFGLLVNEFGVDGAP